jgi:hypothetical protein
LTGKRLKKDPSEILELPEKIAAAKKKKIIVCIDEFQNLSFFDNTLALQKKLRAHWQRHHKAVHCLYGSKRYMLMDFFTRPSILFCQFREILFLEFILYNDLISCIRRYISTVKFSNN